MDVKTYSKAADFISVTGDLLQSDEVRYNLIYGIVRRVVVNPHYYGEEDPWFCTVSDSSRINALVWRTPPHPVGFAWNAGDPERVVPLLIEAVRNYWQQIPGVTGHREVTDPFAESWSKTCGTSIQSTMAQRIYRLDSVNKIPSVPGRIRLAISADKDLVSSWVHAFAIDSFGESYRNRPVGDATPRIEKGEIYLWEDAGKPVSMAGKGRPTKHGMSVAPVYTPPELRRQGYATACVAGVCRAILKSGYDFCTIYTDLGNPTSNSIYMKVGFKPVCDSVHHTFSVPTT